MQSVSKGLPRILLLALLCGVTACGAERDRPAEVDLLAGLPTAQRRAAGNIDEAIRADVVGVGGDARTALVMRSPARVTWPVQLPMHATLVSALALVPDPGGAPAGVTVRIGLSDGRRYLEIGKAEVTGTWVPLTLDLREYSEWKFSVFYQPLRKTWQLILNADATPGGAVAWDVPRLTKS
jgi:hypothetical protein